MSEYFRHNSSYVDQGAMIGDGTKIWHFCHVMGGSQIGSDCVLGQNVFVGPRVIVGNGVKIQNNVSVYDGVILEDGVFCGPSMVFTNVNNPRASVERKTEFRSTVVKQGASLGANCTVVCGAEIGACAFVGAGSVVTSNVPAHRVVYGVPARPKGWICECGEFLPETLECEVCGLGYENDGKGGLKRK